MNFTWNREIVFQSRFNTVILDEYIDNEGNTKQWEISEKPDSVSSLVENVSNKTFIFVEQYRRPLEYSWKSEWRIIELVAWLVDKQWKSLEQIMSEEIREEIWYNTESISHVLSSPKSAGQSTEYSHLFYSTVSWNAQEQILWASEKIDVLEIPKLEVYNFLKSKQQEWIVVSAWIKTMLWEYARMKNPQRYMEMFA